MTEKRSTIAQLRDDKAPAASPLGTDDEAAGTPATEDRVEMARQAETKIGGPLKRGAGEMSAVENAHAQRGSSAPYSKEDHMNEELAKQKETGKVEEDPSEQPS